jgi:hypothetical protein
LIPGGSWAEIEESMKNKKKVLEHFNLYN